MNVRRAFLAAALQVTVTAVFVTAVALILAPIGDLSVRGQFWDGSGTVASTPQTIVGVLAAFFAGWWGATGLTRRWLEQGFLIGVVVAFFGALLAFIEGQLGARTDSVLVAGSAAVLGSALARLQPRIRRALIAAALQVIAASALMLLAFVVFGAWLMNTRGQIGSTEAAMIQSYLSIVGLGLLVVTAFLAGWWGARGFSARAVEQGLITAVMIVVFSYGLTVLLGRPLGWLDVLLLAPVAGVATAGAVFERWRSRADAIS